MKRIIVGISGASGLELGIRFIDALPSELEKYCILSQGAKRILALENLRGMQKATNVLWLEDNDLGACISSGSFYCEAMAIIPCSMNTLAKIANGIADTLITRSASVMLKEQRKLLLAPREMPLSAIALENMLKLSRLGVGIAPPIFGYYALEATQNLESMEQFFIGKWLDMLQIPCDYNRWCGNQKH